MMTSTLMNSARWKWLNLISPRHTYICISHLLMETASFVDWIFLAPGSAYTYEYRVLMNNFNFQLSCLSLCKVSKITHTKVQSGTANTDTTAHTQAPSHYQLVYFAQEQRLLYPWSMSYMVLLDYFPVFLMWTLNFKQPAPTNNHLHLQPLLVDQCCTLIV